MDDKMAPVTGEECEHLHTIQLVAAITNRWPDRDMPQQFCRGCGAIWFRDGTRHQVTLANAQAQKVVALKAALEHATWMNKWQFDEHRTGGYGQLKDEGFCRCDWCKTYRATRYEDSAALSTPTTEEVEG